MIILTRPSKGGISTGGVYSQTEKLNMELEMAYKAVQVSNFKELTYLNGNLSNITIYTDNSKVTPLFTKDLIYDSTSSNLIEIILVRNSDSEILTKSLDYDNNGNLSSITQVKG